MATTLDNNPVSPIPSDPDAQRAAYDRLTVELLPHNKTALFNALAAAGITAVVVDFDGSSDEGQISNIEVKAGDDVLSMPAGTVEIARAVWGQAAPKRESVGLDDVVEQFVYFALETTHLGWEDGDGAYGTVTFDVAARTITLDFNERFVTSDYSQHVL